MKVAMIGHKRVPSREGGIEIVVEELSKRLIMGGVSVDIYNRKSNHVAGKEFNKKEHLEGARTYEIPTPNKKSLNAIVYAFLSFLLTIPKRYSVIHCHGEGSASLLFIPHFFRIPIVTTIHGLDWKRSKWGGFAKKYLLFGEKMAVKYSDEIIVLSEDMRKYFWKTYKRYTIFIPNGVTKPVTRKADKIKKYGLEKDNYILYLGRLVPEKGLDILTEAYSEIETDKKLVIAGGSSHTDAYVNQLKEKAKKNKNIIFTGFVEGKILDELYSNTYCYILPSYVEGMPLSLLEAMSYGNACLTSDIGENVNVIEEHGLTFKTGSKEDLKEKMQFILDHKELKEKLEQTTSEFILNKYDWNEITKKTYKVYRKAIKSAKNK